MSQSKALPVSEAAADWLLSALGNERLFQAVLAVPLLQDAVFRGGFQPAPATLAKPAVRMRLRAALLGRLERVEALLRQALEAPWAPACRALQILDADWLRRHWRDLLRGTGSPALAVAMAIDARPAVRRRGLRLLRRQALWRPDWPARPERLPAEVRLLAPFAPVAVPAAPPAPAAGVVDAGLQHDIAAQREALARQRDKVREGEHELRQARLEGEQRERELRRELREARAASEQAVGAVEARVTAAVAAFKREALGLTPEVARLADAATAVGTVALLARAEDVLAEQRRQNELHGTYEAIRARIRELAAMAQRLGVCMDESVKVLPDVRRVHAAVCRELDRLQSLLPEADILATDLATQLMARIKEAAPASDVLPQLDRLEGLLDLDLIADLLGAASLRHVREALAQRRRLIAAVVHAGGAPVVAAAAVRVREIWDVRAALNGGAAPAIHVFVDGYNVIRRVPELALHELNEGMSRSRDIFCGLCRVRARSFARVEVVFDGQGALSAREERDGLTVVFSNGLRESQNADEYLLARLGRARIEGGAVWLVTDDRGLRAQAEPCCDAFVGCADWHRFLR
jgi:hypothetical protein